MNGVGDRSSSPQSSSSSYYSCTDGDDEVKEYVGNLPIDESTRILRIEDLSEVLEILGKYNFNTSQYFNFCLFLGLFHNTICRISVQYRDPQDCLRECLALWLSKADGVPNKGGPTWCTLMNALRSVSVAIADKIDKEKHAACVLLVYFKLNYISDDFFGNTFPKESLNLLVKEVELSPSVYAADRDSHKIFNALKKAICSNCEYLQKFSYILCMSCMDKSTRNIGKAITNSYSKIKKFCNNNTESGSSGIHDGRPKSKTVSVSSETSDKFEERRADFADTFFKITEVIGNDVELEKLKKYLRLHYSGQPDINKCITVADVIEWISKKCSLTNIKPLDRVMKYFKVDKAISIMQEYNARNKEFFDEMSLRLCLNEFLSPPSVLQLEKIEFLVNKSVDECTFKDIEKFIEVATEDLSEKVLVSVIKKGNSFSIFCSFPFVLSERLISTALKNLKVLKDNGLLKLTIGYCTVYDYKDESLCYPEEGEALDEYITAVYTSRGTLEQLLIATSIQLMYREEQDKEEIEALEKKIELLNEHVSLFQDLSEKKEDYPLEDETTQTGKSQMLEEKEIATEEMEDPKGIEKKEQDTREKDFIIAKKTKQVSKLTKKLEDNTEEIKNKDAKISADGVELISLKAKLTEKEMITRAYQTEANNRIPTLNFLDDAIYTPPVDVIMMAFDKYNKLDEDWYSRAFYTHHTNGYKMCLCVRYDDKKKSSKLHAHLMAGDYDDDLQWPFHGTLMTEILHRKTRTFRYLAEIVFDDDKFCGRIWNGVPTEAGMASSIVGEGISLAEAVQESFTEYVEDNSIVIRVKSVNVESLVRTSAITSPPPIKEEMLFEITGFFHHKESNSECISEEFYSARPGYKFVLMVYPNGRSHFQGRSVSIFAHISMGDYDNELPFPFRGKIIVQIVNRLDTLRNHVEKMIEFTDKTDPEERFGAKVTGLTRYFGSGHSHQGFGYHDMLRHEFLKFDLKHRTEYLKDDSLIVRVTKIEDYNV